MRSCPALREAKNKLSYFFSFSAAVRAHYTTKSKAAREFGLTVHDVRYWQKKIDDPLYHFECWGGSRNEKFDSSQKSQIYMIVWLLCKYLPFITLKEVKTELHVLGFDMSKSWCIYGERCRAVGPIGKPITIIQQTNLSDSYSMTLGIGLDILQVVPLRVDLRKQNTAMDFINFVAFLITDKFLSIGDYLIMDNASIHNSAEILSALDNVWALQSVEIPSKIFS